MYKKNKFFVTLYESIYRSAYSTNYILNPILISADFKSNYLLATISKNTNGSY